jgi:hypothetical protein
MGLSSSKLGTMNSIAVTEIVVGSSHTRAQASRVLVLSTRTNLRMNKTCVSPSKSKKIPLARTSSQTETVSHRHTPNLQRVSSNINRELMDSNQSNRALKQPLNNTAATSQLCELFPKNREALGSDAQAPTWGDKPKPTVAAHPLGQTKKPHPDKDLLPLLKSARKLISSGRS